MSRAPSTGEVEVPGGRISYDEAGDGPAIVFIHAAIADRRMWESEFHALAPGAHVIRYDVRGFGRSPAATAAYSDHADLEILLDRLHVPSAVLVGCSNGGRIAIDFTLEHPRRVRGLVAVASGIGGFDATTDEMRATFEEEGKQMRPMVEAYRSGDRVRARELLRAFWCGQQSGASLELVRRMLDDNLDEAVTDRSAQYSQPIQPLAVGRLHEIHTPTLLLSAEKDAPGMRFFLDRLAHDIPNARRFEVPGADHLVNLSNPAVFRRELGGFLRALPAP